MPSTFLSTENTAVSNLNEDLCPLGGHVQEYMLGVHSLTKKRGFNKVSEMCRIWLMIRAMEKKQGRGMRMSGRDGYNYRWPGKFH